MRTFAPLLRDDYVLHETFSTAFAVLAYTRATRHSVNDRVRNGSLRYYFAQKRAELCSRTSEEVELRLWCRFVI